jgi:tetracycline repressor-like protein
MCKSKDIVLQRITDQYGDADWKIIFVLPMHCDVPAGYALAQIIDTARRRGQVSRSAASELAVDQVFGVLWYRMIFGHQPLTRGPPANLPRPWSPN